MSESVFNEGSVDVDFRVEGNGVTHAFFVEGETDKVGIGESDPDEVVHIKNANAAIKYESTAGSGYTWNTGNIVTNGNFTFSSNTTNNVLTLANDGNVGIGVTAPTDYNANSDNLVIFETGDDSGITLVADNDRGSNIYFADAQDDNVGGLSYNHSNNKMTFRTNGASRMEIESDGTVVIPGALQPAGNITTSGNITTAEDKRISIGTWDNSGFTGSNAYGLSIDSELPIVHMSDTDTNKKAFFGLSGDNMYIGGNPVDDMIFQTGSGVEKMRIESGGDIKMTELLYVNNAVNHGRTTAGSTFRCANNGDAAITLLSASNISAGVGEDMVALNFAANNYWSTTKDGVYGQIRCEGGHGGYGDRGQLVFATGYDGATINDRMRITSDGYVTVGGSTTNNVNLTVNGSSGSARVVPQTDNTGYLGESNHRWQAVYAVTGSIQTSDKNLKTSITSTDLGLDFINKLNPVSYKWKVGGYDITEATYDDKEEKTERIETPISGKRKHYGLIAQEVKEVLGNNDFGGWVKEDLEDSDSLESLRYDQFIAPLVKAVQELSAKVEALENA